MAGDDAELIGGISVSIGASHAKLVSDLAEADRILEAWSKQVFTAKVGAQFTGVQGQPVAPQRQQAPPPVRVGATARAGAQGGEQTASQRAINAELAKTGQHYNAITGEIEDSTAAIGKQRQVVAQVQQQASVAVPLNIETKGLQDSLDALLATMKELVDTSAQLAKAPVGAGGGGGGGAARGLRRRNITARDIGTAADRNRVYTFDPEVYAQQEAQQEVKAARQRELALSAHLQSQQRADATQARQAATASTAARRNNDAQARAAFLNGPIPPGAGSPVIASATIEPFRGPNSPPPPGSTPIRPKTDVERAEQERRDRETADRFNAQSRAPRRSPEERAAQAARGEQEERTRAAFLASSRVRQYQIDEEAQARTVASRRASITGSGRTSRTLASGISALFGGTEGRQIEAQAVASQAARQLSSAERAIEPLDNRLRELARSWSGSTGAVRQFNREQFLAIRRSAEYTGALNKVRGAIEDDAAAQEKLGKISSGGNILRNLAAITAGGAAFGIALKGVDIALAAGSKAAAPYFDQFTGYAQKTADLTSALADQARQQQGNAQAVTAIKLASTGFAQSTADTLQPIIAQRVQIEAGNKALVDQIETFREAEQLRSQGRTAGLTTGTGGVLGTPLFAIPSTGEQTGNFLSGLGRTVQQRQDVATVTNNALIPNSVDPIGRFLGINKGPSQTTVNQQAIADAQAAFNRGLTFINNQLNKGGATATQFAQATSLTDTRIEQTASAFDSLSPEMAKAIRDNHLYADAISGSSDAIGSALAALKAIDLAGTITGPQEQLAAVRLQQQNSRNSIGALQQQQAFAQPAFESNLRRTTGQQLNIQIPAQQALQNLIAPPTPVGTGLRAANAKEQRQINAETKVTQGLQDQLNVEYAKGQQILEDTYKPQIIQTFGAAAGQAFSQLLGQITATGQEIAKIQAGITNEQAGYAVAQYNFQLMIAKRTLGDIEGLTGQNYGVQKTQLGVLEGQNLALSRQAQLLQFGLSQRQINLQTAVAGFTVPGLTPAEQNARVTEAKVEADYAQKQLDIQTKMFHNQVKIVDIGNLRQGADLLKQIGLLQRGRQVTLDTAAAQQKLERLNKLQQQQVAKVSTYINAVDAVVSHTNELIAQQETALGRALNSIEVQAVAVATHVGRAFFIAASGGFLGGGGASSHANGDLNNTTGRGHASGFIGKTNGMTPLGPGDYAGEANNEVVAILRNPRALTGSGGSDGHITINFNGDNVFRTEADFQRMYRMVVTALGKEAAGKGLRTPF